MLTLQKLKGSTSALTRYHTMQENYYFKKPATGDEKILDNSGVDVLSDTPLNYVTIGGILCTDFKRNEGDAISQFEFEMLLQGNFLDGSKCTQKHRNCGYDLVFSAPKTLSIAGLITEKDPQLIECHNQAVKETMKQIQNDYSLAQPKPGIDVISDGMIWAEVIDCVSRENDPQIHTHVVVANITKVGGKYMALRPKNILRREFNRAFGTYYRMLLAEKLTALGYSVSYVKGGEIRLDKVAHILEDEFSTRRKQIASEKIKNPEMSDKKAWKKTRKKKDPKASIEDIKASWQEKTYRIMSENKTKTPEDNKAQTIKNREKWALDTDFNIEAVQIRNGRSNATEIEQWLLAMDRAINKSGVATEIGVIGEYISEKMAAEKWKSEPLQVLKELLARQVEDEVIYKTEKGNYTSYKYMLLERELIGYTDKTNEDFHFESNSVKKLIKKHSKAKGRQLSEIQTDAVEKILNNKDFITIVQGDAGSGKTSMLDVVNKICLYEDRAIRGLAMQAVAVKNLKNETDIESTTVSSYLKSDNNDRCLLVVDEASMLDTRSMHALCVKARRCGCKLILVGDKNQLGSIQAGNVFARYVEDAEKKGKLVSLTENFRQESPELQEVVKHAREGNMTLALKILDTKLKSIHVMKNPKKRREEIAGLYSNDTLIISGTVDGRNKLNLIIRNKLIEDKKINANGNIYKMEGLDNFGEKREYDLELSKGDQITFTKNDYKIYGVKNGERAIVTGLQGNVIAVEMRDVNKTEINIDLNKYKNIDYGYAITTFKAQGLTCERVVIDADTDAAGVSSTENQYVNLTRAKKEAIIYTNNKKELFKSASIKSRKQDTHDEKISTAEIEERIKKISEKIQDRRLAKMNEDIAKIKGSSRASTFTNEL